MTKKISKSNLEVVVTFRMSAEEFAPYKKLIEDSGMSKSSVMRNVFISKSENATLPKQPNKDTKRIVFLANKTSNNVNQLARKLNIDSLKGKVNKSTYSLMLNNLINIERSFISAIEKC